MPVHISPLTPLMAAICGRNEKLINIQMRSPQGEPFSSGTFPNPVQLMAMIKGSRATNRLLRSRLSGDSSNDASAGLPPRFLAAESGKEYNIDAVTKEESSERQESHELMKANDFLCGFKFANPLLHPSSELREKILEGWSLTNSFLKHGKSEEALEQLQALKIGDTPVMEAVYSDEKAMLCLAVREVVMEKYMNTEEFYRFHLTAIKALRAGFGDFRCLCTPKKQPWAFELAVHSLRSSRTSKPFHYIKNIKKTTA